VPSPQTFPRLVGVSALGPTMNLVRPLSPKPPPLPPRHAWTSDTRGSVAHGLALLHKIRRGCCVEKGIVSKNPGFFSRCTKDSNIDPTEDSKNGGFSRQKLLPSGRSTGWGLTQRRTTGRYHGFIQDASRVQSPSGDLAFLLGDCGTSPQFLIRKLLVLAPVALSRQQILTTMTSVLSRPPFEKTNAENAIDEPCACFRT
jgi:hypothetical protein